MDTRGAGGIGENSAARLQGVIAHDIQVIDGEILPGINRAAVIHVAAAGELQAVDLNVDVAAAVVVDVEDARVSAGVDREFRRAGTLDGDGIGDRQLAQAQGNRAAVKLWIEADRRRTGMALASDSAVRRLRLAALKLVSSVSTAVVTTRLAGT